MTTTEGPPVDGVVVGIDIGGTKTHLRAEGRGVSRERIVPSREWRKRNWDLDAATIAALARELAGADQLSALGVGAHGCDDADECTEFQAAIERQVDFPVRVVNDAELMPVAAGFPGQIGVVAGTGSIAVCRSPEGEMLVAGGWGWVIGDEGSACGLVREATRAVALHLDRGGDPNDPLAKALFEAFSIPSAARLGSAFAAAGVRGGAGKYSQVVFSAADAGSKLAQDTIEDGGRELAWLVHRLKGRGATATHAVAGGGVIAAQPRLWRAFSKALGKVSEGSVTPHLFTGKPVTGACRIAHALTFRAPGAVAASNSHI